MPSVDEKLDRISQLLEHRDGELSSRLDTMSIRLEGFSDNLSQCHASIGVLDATMKGMSERVAQLGANMSGVVTEMQASMQEVALVQARVARHSRRISDLVKKVDGVKEVSQVFQVKTMQTWKVICIVLGALTTAGGIALAVAKLLI